MASVADRERVRERLQTDFAYYAPRCLKIIDAAARVVPFDLKPAQLKLWAALEAQRDAGQPMRAIVLKARKLGFSTEVQGLVIQRATQMPNHRAQVVAHDNDTAGALFDIGKFMWANLPEQIKPQLQAERNSKGGLKYMGFGEASAVRRREGIMGLNSSVEIDTAREVQSGRGLTIHTLHLSEVAFWGDVRKMTALLNAVPDDPMTLIVQESTANGQNHFKDTWDRAEAGDSAYAAVFVGWHEEAGYARLFASEEERESFRETIGTGPWGEEEPELMDRFGCTPEQLNWRRWTIVNKCEAKLEVFHAEYPSTPEQAFLTTGRQVFSRELLKRVLDGTQLTDPVVPSAERPGPRLMVMRPTSKRLIRGGGSSLVEVPVAVELVAREQVVGAMAWRIFEEPVAADGDTPAGQYVVAVDPMSGDERSSGGEPAWHGVQVLDHRTRRQVAEYRSRIDPDELAYQVLMAGLLYNRAWIAVEVTGGWGLSVVRALAISFKYPFVYTRQPSQDQRTEKYFDRLGWDTNRATKQILIDGAKELLRTGKHGVRSRLLAKELGSYVKDERGRTFPEHGKHSDLLMAWMIAQQVCQERPLRPDRSKATSTSTRSIRSPVTGY